MAAPVFWEVSRFYHVLQLLLCSKNILYMMIIYMHTECRYTWTIYTYMTHICKHIDAKTYIYIYNADFFFFFKKKNIYIYTRTDTPCMLKVLVAFPKDVKTPVLCITTPSQNSHVGRGVASPVGGSSLIPAGIERPESQQSTFPQQLSVGGSCLFDRPKKRSFRA